VFAAAGRRPELSCPIVWTPPYGGAHKARAGSIHIHVRRPLFVILNLFQDPRRHRTISRGPETSSGWRENHQFRM